MRWVITTSASRKPVFKSAGGLDPDRFEFIGEKTRRRNDANFISEFVHELDEGIWPTRLRIKSPHRLCKAFQCFLCDVGLSKHPRACVGCSCVPSPALMTEPSSAAHKCGTRFGVRMTSASIRIASRFKTVSSSVSPFWSSYVRREYSRIGPQAFGRNLEGGSAYVWMARKKIDDGLAIRFGVFFLAERFCSRSGSAVKNKVNIGDSQPFNIGRW